MVHIDRCLCTGLTFTDLLDQARSKCMTLPQLVEDTGSGDGCTRCLPYLRVCFRTGQTEFRELLPVETGGLRENDAIPPLPSPMGKVVMSWSGGKDSALALHRLGQDPRYEVVGLMTTVSLEHRRISHHGVREELLELQAEALGLPLTKVYFPPTATTPPTMEAFDEHMGAILADWRAQGVFLVAHGDIHLADLREARLARLHSVGMDGVFPLWQESVEGLLEEFFESGFRARLTCVEPVLGAGFAGAELARELLPRLPPEVDICGENGEYHSFVYAGPLFPNPIPLVDGGVVERDGRHYFELFPGHAVAPQNAATPTS